MIADDIPHVVTHLLEKHGLAQQGWAFQWDNARRRAGSCRYYKKLITLSRHYVALNVRDRLDDVIDTILHEIAHALTPGHNHDDAWKAKAEEIGARPERCYDSATVQMPKGKYVARCGGCGKEWRRHRPVKRGRCRYCAACGPDVGRLRYVDVREQEPPADQPSPDAPPPPRKLR